MFLFSSRRRGAGPVICTIAVTAGLAGAAASAAAAGIPPGTAPIDPEAPAKVIPDHELRASLLPAAVDYYADRYDVSRDVAKDRLVLQAQVNLGLGDLRKRVGTDALGSVRFDPQTGDAVVPTATAAAARDVTAWAARREIPTNAVRITETDQPLQATASDAATLRRSLRDELRTGDARLRTTPAGKVVVEVVEDASTATKARARQAAASVDADVETLPSDVALGSPTFACGIVASQGPRYCDILTGGVTLTRSDFGVCTMGFFVGSPWPVLEPYILYAGHCIRSAGETSFSCSASANNCAAVGTALNKMYGPGHGGDAGLIKFTNTASWQIYPGWMNWNPAPPAVQTTSVVRDYARANVAVGTVACKNGQTTGTSCGTVSEQYSTTTYTDGQTVVNMLKFSGLCLLPGDSGSPVTLAASEIAVGVASASNTATQGCGSASQVSWAEPVHRALQTTGTVMMTATGPM